MTNQQIFKTQTLTLTKCRDGYWLFDTTRGMNLGIRADSEQIAFIQALEYYQKRLTGLEAAHKCLNDRVEEFVEQFTQNED
jgi:hypothetical protein